MTQTVLPAILFIIMFSMGLALTLQEFKNIAKFPKAFFVGAILQIISLPLLAFAFASFGVGVMGILPAFAVGLMIIAACPGGVTSNMLTHLGDGDTALSISLTSAVSFLSVLTIPTIVNSSLGHFMGAEQAAALDVLSTTVRIFIITVIPLSIGMLIKAYASNFADKLEPYARKLATGLFLLVVAAVILKNRNELMAAYSLIPLILAFNVFTMFFAYQVSKLSKMSGPQARAVTYECGLQNGTMAIMIALSMLENREMMIPGAIYSILMFVTAAGFMFLTRSKKNSGEPNPQSTGGHKLGLSA